MCRNQKDKEYHGGDYKVDVYEKRSLKVKRFVVVPVVYGVKRGECLECFSANEKTMVFEI